MNILINPILHPLLQLFISILLILGTIQIGSNINSYFTKSKNFLNSTQSWFLNFLVGVILLSQTVYVLIISTKHSLIIPLFSILILNFGIYLFIKLLKKRKFPDIKKYNFVDYFILINFLSFFIISAGPPTMADALDYNYGVAKYLINFSDWPPVSLWLHGSIAGLGEVYSSLGLFLNTDNLGGIIQSLSLIFFCFFLSSELNNENYSKFIKLFIISSPVIIFLVSGPKFQLFPQILTTTALFLTLKKKKIDLNEFLVISILLMGATQFKLSFLISGLPVGILAIYKLNKKNFNFFISVLILFIFFFLPRGLWNISQVYDPTILNIISPLPNEFVSALKNFRENSYFFPINIFIFDRLGAISSIIGFQIFLILFIKKMTKEFKIIIILIFVNSIFQFFLSMPIGRVFFEMVLWSSIGFCFTSKKQFNFELMSKILIPQTILVFIIGLYGTAILLPSFISINQREKVMTKYSYEYEGLKWVNKNIPKDAVILSNLRSVSLLDRNFAPTDWLNYNLTRDKLNSYYEELKRKKINYFIVKNQYDYSYKLRKCVGNLFLKSPEFNDAKRNPFNITKKYIIEIYKFDHKKLKSCAS